MDLISKERRSWNMSRIRNRDTSPELIVRSTLHRLGFRFRLHKADLPGKPDIVLPKWHSVILVNGCFWHRHKGCKFAYNPKSRIQFWRTKFKENVSRDERCKNELRSVGWRVHVVWECQTHDREKLERYLLKFFRNRAK